MFSLLLYQYLIAIKLVLLNYLEHSNILKLHALHTKALNIAVTYIYTIEYVTAA